MLDLYPLLIHNEQWKLRPAPTFCELKWELWSDQTVHFPPTQLAIHGCSSLPRAWVLAKLHVCRHVKGEAVHTHAPPHQFHWECSQPTQFLLWGLRTYDAIVSYNCSTTHDQWSDYQIWWVQNHAGTHLATLLVQECQEFKPFIMEF